MCVGTHKRPSGVLTRLENGISNNNNTFEYDKYIFILYYVFRELNGLNFHDPNIHYQYARIIVGMRIQTGIFGVK